jgi:polysaccharide export outer membrane protein
MTAMQKSWTLILHSSLLAFLILTVVGCAAPRESAEITSFAVTPATKEREQAGAEYRLQRGDVLDVKFFHTPELSETVTTRPDGKISLQLIGEIEVVGLTPQLLVRKLQERYTGILRAPEIAVIVQKFAAQKAYIGGEVNAPGLISFDAQPTLLQALIEVGWLKKSAEPSTVVIIRNMGDGRPAFFTVNVLKGIREPGVPPTLLQPFDVVYVPKSTVAKVNDFIEQYIDNAFLTPISRLVGFSFFYNLNPERILRPGITE